MNESSGGAAPRPLTWVLTGHKAGDNTQVLALANALGWPFEVKQLKYKSYELLTNRLFGVTLSGIDRAASSHLEPPWPDLVITAGRRNEPVARWICRQSGGRTRLVHIGRPWAALDHFDLIITTPQYFLPQRDNVLHNQLPLHRISNQHLAAEAERWKARIAHLPRPYITVLLGGDSGPFVFTAEKGQRFGRCLDQLAHRLGGTLLITDSARTPHGFFEAFSEGITSPAYVYRWHAGGEDNPYLAFLGLADHLVVTGESMSMLSEAATTGKPLYIFDPGEGPVPGSGRHTPWWLHRYNFRYKPLTHRIAMAIGPRRMRRDVGKIQHALVSSGRAVWLGQEFPQDISPCVSQDLERAVARVRRLFQ